VLTVLSEGQAMTAEFSQKPQKSLFQNIKENLMEYKLLILGNVGQRPKNLPR
jgi:hypothetical protein